MRQRALFCGVLCSVTISFWFALDVYYSSLDTVRVVEGRRRCEIVEELYSTLQKTLPVDQNEFFVLFLPSWTSQNSSHPEKITVPLFFRERMPRLVVDENHGRDDVTIHDLLDQCQLILLSSGDENHRFMSKTAMNHMSYALHQEYYGHWDEKNPQHICVVESRCVESPKKNFLFKLFSSERSPPCESPKYGKFISYIKLVHFLLRGSGSYCAGIDNLPSILLLDRDTLFTNFTVSLFDDVYTPISASISTFQPLSFPRNGTKHPLGPLTSELVERLVDFGPAYSISDFMRHFDGSSFDVANIVMSVDLQCFGDDYPINTGFVYMKSSPTSLLFTFLLVYNRVGIEEYLDQELQGLFIRSTQDQRVAAFLSKVIFGLDLEYIRDFCQQQKLQLSMKTTNEEKMKQKLSMPSITALSTNRLLGSLVVVPSRYNGLIPTSQYSPIGLFTYSPFEWSHGDLLMHFAGRMLDERDEALGRFCSHPREYYLPDSPCSCPWLSPLCPLWNLDVVHKNIQHSVENIVDDKN